MLERKEHSYFIKTFGCQANLADSQKLAGFLDLLGFVELFPPEFKTEREELSFVLSHVDILIINSCSVRQKSEDKVYGMGKTVREYLKDKHGKKPLIILTGCMVGSTVGERRRLEPNMLRKKTKFINVYLDTGSLDFLPTVLKDNGLTPLMPTGDYANVTPKKDISDSKHAYVNISTGCDNFCTYCVVPYSRGREVSRGGSKILDEIKKLLKLGVEEITLCGQNVNSWGLGQKEKSSIRIGTGKVMPFVGLLKKIHDLDGIKKLDFISSNPFDFTDDLVGVLKLPKISNYIHIAVQSGNDGILKAMNRRHTAREFEDLVARIRKIRPGIEIGTDIIVGFPGETKEQFLDTAKLVKKLKFNVAFISMYSPRKGTVADTRLVDNVSKEEKKSRLAYLTKVWKEAKHA